MLELSLNTLCGDILIETRPAKLDSSCRIVCTTILEIAAEQSLRDFNAKQIPKPFNLSESLSREDTWIDTKECVGWGEIMLSMISEISSNGSLGSLPETLNKLKDFLNSLLAHDFGDLQQEIEEAYSALEALEKEKGLSI